MQRLFSCIRRFFLLLILAVLISVPSATMASEEAVFAGGCFWCLEHDLEELSGVNKVVSGYTGGVSMKPTYSSHEGHQESVLVDFSPELINYEELLRSYWRNIDPVDGGGQFCDRGDSYKPVIFTMNENQEIEAISSATSASNELGISLNSIKVQIIKATKFWPAEQYHQDFAIRNNLKYNFYRYSCGRDLRLKEVWGAKASTSNDWGQTEANINKT